MFPPERIVCLTEETVETLYLLGEERRIVGISGYVVRPPRARREKPRVSVLTFSDLQADIAAKLIRAGVDVHAFNQRTIPQILDMIRMLGALVGAADRADRLADDLAAIVTGARERGVQLPQRPKVYFEEWDDPMISGIGWVSELIDAAGGIRYLCRSRILQIGQGSDRNHGGNHPTRARYHCRLLVRQKVSPGKSSKQGGI
jgi:iron complex transport system substrate-binding protein